jgi:hypothetical protein
MSLVRKTIGIVATVQLLLGYGGKLRLPLPLLKYREGNPNSLLLLLGYGAAINLPSLLAYANAQKYFLQRLL